jgi:hypothetical protein
MLTTMSTFDLAIILLQSELGVATIDVAARVCARGIANRSIVWIHRNFGSHIVASILSRVSKLPRPQKSIGHSQGHSRILGAR